MKNKKQRWFVLTKDSLSYYKTPTDLRTPLGVIMLNEATVELLETDSLSFLVINQAIQKEYYITAKTEKERDLWYSYIYAAIKNLDKH